MWGSSKRFCVASQQSRPLVWLVLNCETHVEPIKAVQGLFPFLTPSAVLGGSVFFMQTKIFA